MYKGEINVGQEQLPLLLQAAETLQVRKHYNIISDIREEDLKIVCTFTDEDKFSDFNVNSSQYRWPYYYFYLHNILYKLNFKRITELRYNCIDIVVWVYYNNIVF